MPWKQRHKEPKPLFIHASHPGAPGAQTSHFFIVYLRVNLLNCSRFQGPEKSYLKLSKVSWKPFSGEHPRSGFHPSIHSNFAPKKALIWESQCPWTQNHIHMAGLLSSFWASDCLIKYISSVLFLLHVTDKQEL